MAASIALLGVPGCAGRDPGLLSWRRGAAEERVFRFGIHSEDHVVQWFTRVVNTEALPDACVHPLSDKFDLVIIRDAGQWGSVIEATNMRGDLKPPPLRHGLLVGLLARAGEAADQRWPIVITAARRRERIAFLEVRFKGGYYRPLRVPPYLHLVFLPEVRDILGIRLNQALYGFNVAIEDLQDAGIL
ncbi:MAG: hypothetical protein ACE5EC_03260 [Phycisphaerae bacterium]